MKIIKKNRKSRDCGVIAAYNAASWCKMPKTYKEIEKTARSCGYSYKKGIYFFQFANLIKKMGLPAKRVKMMNADEIQSNLYLGRFYIFLYTPTGEASGHAMTAFCDHEGMIRLINPDLERVTWDEFASDCSVNGMKCFVAYELPHRGLLKNDGTRAD